MDVAYDHIQEEALSPDSENHDGQQQRERAPSTTDLNTEFREAYKAFTTSSWGVKLGGFWGSVKKQGESYYEEARKELSAASTDASKGFSELRTHTEPVSASAQAGDDKEEKKEGEPSREAEDEKEDIVKVDKPESLPADIVKEAQSMYSSFRTKAAERLKRFEKAEDAADEALLKFGTNIRNFLREAVTIAPPSGDDGGVQRSVLFESKDSEGRRVVHATRFEAQLHVIHSTLPSFTQDPQSEEYKPWKESFNTEKKTEAIVKDLEKYPELRRAMEKLVPEAVEYPDFWTRYYFLRHVIETEEQKRRELLKGTQNADEEEIGWDDDDDEEDDDSKTPNVSKLDVTTESAAKGANKSQSGPGLLKPGEPRRSNEHSVAGSDASYDLVSGATSRSPGSPKEDAKELDKKKTNIVAEESDEEDWE